MPTTLTKTQAGNGAHLVSVQEGKDLPLEEVRIGAEAVAGLAQLTIRQTYRNLFDEPLEATYTLPLPAEASVGGYSMTIGNRVVTGVIRTREQARIDYEKAKVEGHTASVIDQERTSVFTQHLGNIPPRAQVVIEVTVDQPLIWIDGGAWEWRFPTVVAPRYLGEQGRVPDAGAVTVDVADGPTGIGATLDLRIGDTIREGGRPESPSHAIRFEEERVTLDGAKARLDRDLVVRWKVEAPAPGASLRRTHVPASEDGSEPDHACGLLTIVPPAAPARTIPRDLILLIDTSGSMSDQPLDRAKTILTEIIDSLGDEDRLEMISFASAPVRWQHDAVHATARNRRRAIAWVDALQAGGGTEMTQGLLEALTPLRPDAQRQVILVTDGEIGFESEIVTTLRDRLPGNCRLHALGVGSAVNRSLTRPAARAGRGCEVVVDLAGSVEEAARRIVSATAAPVLTDLRIEGDAVLEVAPGRLPDVMAGSPVLAGVRLKAEGGSILVSGLTAEGPWSRRLEVPPTGPGEGDAAVARLVAREKVDDLEMDLAAGAPHREDLDEATPSGREEIDAAIERIGLRYRIATRLTSWIAISEDRTVDPKSPTRAVAIPQELPYGMSAEGLGLVREAWGSEARLFGSPMTTKSRFLRSMSTLSMPSRHEVEAYLSDLVAGRAMTARFLPPTKDGLLVVEITLEEGTVEWTPDDAVTVELEDGTTVDLDVDPDASTRAARIETGMRFRIGLKEVAGMRDRIAALHLTSGGESFRVPIR